MCCTGKWQTQIYKNIFYNKEQDTDNSYFVNEPLMSILPKRLLTDTELKAAGEGNSFTLLPSLGEIKK